MSSHHLNHDPNYLLRLQNMRISEGNKSPHRLENNLKDNQQQQQPQQMVNPKNYDRNTILTSSKFVNHKSVENVAKQQQQHHQQHSSQGGYYLNNSPTHSLSGSSQHSESPRTSLIGAGQLVYDARSGHLYENLDYYTQHSPTEQIGYFESSNKKAQPQVPIGGSIHGIGGHSINSTNGISTGRYAHTPQPEYEPPPIYENLQQVTGQRAQPQASPANATMYYERNGSNSPHQQQQQQQPQLPPPYPSSNALNQSRNSPIQRGQHSHTSSNASIKSQYSNNGQTIIGGNYPKQMPKQSQQQLPQQPSQQQLAQQQNYVQYATMKPISNSSGGSGGVFYSVAPQQSAVPAYEYKAPERHHSSAVS